MVTGSNMREKNAACFAGKDVGIANSWECFCDAGKQKKNRFKRASNRGVYAYQRVASLTSQVNDDIVAFQLVQILCKASTDEKLKHVWLRVWLSPS